MRSRLIFLFCLLLASLIFAYLFRVSILRSVVYSLIREDSLQKADALFVLSGNGFDRGNEAEKIFRAGLVPHIICTGGNPMHEFKVFGIDTMESDVTVANLKRLGIEDSFITKIPLGTSTLEECELILSTSIHHKYVTIMILSSKTHTARVRKLFKAKFKNSGIKVVVRGANSSRYDEMNWWKSEDGLIAVNNEWLKRIYYFFKD